MNELGYLNIGGLDTTYHDEKDEIFYLHYFRSIGAYRIFLESFQFSNSDKKIPVIYNYYGVLDSTTYLTKLPEQIYNEVVGQLDGFCKSSKLCNGFGGAKNPCFENGNIDNLISVLPRIKTSFRDSHNNLLIKEWLPRNYLYMKGNSVCFAVVSWK